MTAGWLVFIMSEFPSEEVADHRQRTLQALQSWDADGPVDFATKLQQTAALDGTGAHGAADADAADNALDAGNAPADFGHREDIRLTDFWNGTLGRGVALALELEKILERMMEPPPGCVCIENIHEVLLDRVASYSARETCRTLDLERSDLSCCSCNHLDLSGRLLNTTCRGLFRWVQTCC